MYEYKKGFTLIEVLLVMALIITLFSMSLTILGSFSTTSRKYVERDFDEVKSIMSQAKYLKFLGERNISTKCSKGKVSLLLDNQIIDEKQLKILTCDNDLKLSNASSTFELKVNKYGYVSFKRI
ncbi:MAG: type II secretion system protein [bacterium]